MLSRMLTIGSSRQALKQPFTEEMKGEANMGDDRGSGDSISEVASFLLLDMRDLRV